MLFVSRRNEMAWQAYTALLIRSPSMSQEEVNGRVKESYIHADLFLEQAKASEAEEIASIKAESSRRLRDMQAITADDPKPADPPEQAPVEKEPEEAAT